MVDAGPLYAQADVDDPHHGSAIRALESERGALVTTELAVAEADYLILDRLGIQVELYFLHDLASRTYEVECLTWQEFEIAHVLAERYRDLRLGLADISLVILAHRYRTKRIATFDERAFRAVSSLDGGAFTLIPADFD